ncbi:unnamed protein product [Acanthosepion pharaonis]|uniref:Uncharacterized protein n=1 Tax=Acanthosepion pharaonis TaxID=158019 RepID=A0A812C9Z9_ACAPH|nr:unnamed protein product [Sepia pharaonis]
MLATCASSCPRIRRNKNLRLKYRSNKRIVYFACRSGFKIIGATSAICNKNTWSTDSPICVAPGCPLLEYDDNVLDVTYTYRHYIYIEASAPRRPGDQARLLSPLYNFKMQAVCFEFWFHMWCPSLTKETGSLQIYAISKKQLLSNLAPLMTLTGDYGNSWKRKRIQLEPMQDTFQIILHATRGQNHQNDIAVDDIQLWAGLCDGNIQHINGGLSEDWFMISNVVDSFGT